MRNLFLIGTIVIFISCNNSIVFEKYITFENQEWNTDSLLSFGYTITDTISTYKLVLNVRHSVEYEYQNLFLFVKSDSSTDTIELLLAEDNGKWTGKGKSNIKEFSTTILSPKIYQNGIQSFSLELAMRDNTSTELEKLNGISDVSFYLTTENED